MTPEETDRLDNVAAEIEAMRAVIAALIWIHPDDEGLAESLKLQSEQTMSTLLAISTTESYLRLVERKLSMYMGLAGVQWPPPQGGTPPRTDSSA